MNLRLGSPATELKVTKSSGGLCGGTYVDVQFMEFLCQTTGPCLQECIIEHPNIYSHLIQAWEHTKANFGDRASIGEFTNINLPIRVITKWEEYGWRMGVYVRKGDKVDVNSCISKIFHPMCRGQKSLVLPLFSSCEMDPITRVARW